MNEEAGVEHEDQLALIARQIEEARIQLDMARKMGQEPELVRANIDVSKLKTVKYVFSGAGIDLEAGQSLLIEPALAKHLIEEALGRLAREQAWLEWETPAAGMAEVWERKIELVAASLIADELIERQAREAA